MYLCISSYLSVLLNSCMYYRIYIFSDRILTVENWFSVSVLIYMFIYPWSVSIYLYLSVTRFLRVE